MNTLYVVAGGPQQRPLRLPAAQLYIGELFSAAITHARRFAKAESEVRVLSPKYGLLSQQRLIEPYRGNLEQLDSDERAHLLGTIKSELPRRGTLPLRIVLLAPENLSSLFRDACAGTRFELVPVRTPLDNLSLAEKIHWLQAATWPIEPTAELPDLERLSLSENERLKNAVRAAAIWWSGQLLPNSPPPEPTLFAGALSLELVRVWEEVAQASRGEWPEDITFPVTVSQAEGPIAAALRAIGLAPHDWWKREGSARPLAVAMRFSMASVAAQNSEGETVIFR